METKMTVGELGKKVNLTVRTLQYYDKIGLLKPSKISEGGRRLYTDKDITILHQIITLKSVGLSLTDIKDRIKPVNTNEDILKMLTSQGDIVKEQISKAQKILESIHMISGEIRDQDIVDWKKYANMVKMIQENNEFYWVINYLEEDLLENISKVHEEYTEEELSPTWLKVCLEKSVELSNRGVSPISNEGQKVASDWWSAIEKYSKGEPAMFTKLFEFYSQGDHWPAEFSEIQKQSQEFLEQAIGYYIRTNNIELG